MRERGRRGRRGAERDEASSHAGSEAGQPRPNRLSGQARPNVLGAAGPAKATNARPSWVRRTAGRAGDDTGPTEGTRPDADAAQPAGRRGPGLGTIVFIGFVVISILRAVGGFLEDAGGSPTPTPPPTPPGIVAPGIVRFGTAAQPDECAVADIADAFPTGTDVWWAAELGQLQEPTVTVVWTVSRDGRRLERNVLPGEPGGGRWDLLCGDEPLGYRQPGTYRVEVRVGSDEELLAVGEYELTPASPTP